ncbi:hypothetical protein P8X24_02695 [Pyrococcus kukulkanii]|uniref:hypothetical protein n=1 Tax=Pyrococcus kukulkanii TaxID=1609559 RepID=UPI000F0FFB8D|nr:MAG: hypothetical protein DRN82_04190 [Thermococci archaeon]
MKVITTETGKEKIVAIALTGDGRTELKVLEAIAQRYNGKERAMLFPKSPLGGTSKGTSIIKTAELVAKITGITTVLIMIDREHVQDIEGPLRETLKDAEIGPGNPIIARSKNMTILVVILGKKKAIEENLAELINLEAGKQVVDPKLPVKELKSQIKYILKTEFGKPKSIKKFLERCKMENIERAFDGLARALKLLEDF